MKKPYKLNNEIIEFILSKKNDNPLVSCRSLEPEIAKKFGVNISKSTISTILKGNNLSSSVGRRRVRPKADIQPEPMQSRIRGLLLRQANAEQADNKDIKEERLTPVPEPPKAAEPVPPVVPEPPKIPEPEVKAPEPELVKAPEPEVPETPEPEPVKAPEPEIPKTPEPGVVKAQEPEISKPPEPEPVKTPEPEVPKAPESRIWAPKLPQPIPGQQVSGDGETPVFEAEKNAWQPPAPPVIKKPEFSYFTENDIFNCQSETDYLSLGGCLILEAAELKSSLIFNISSKLQRALPGIPLEFLHLFSRAQVYKPLFKEMSMLWNLLGNGISENTFKYLCDTTTSADISEIRQDLIKDGYNNSSNINELYKEVLSELNSMAQKYFFPSIYQYLDLRAMFSKFYCLTAKRETSYNVLNVQFYCKSDFPSFYDQVWQEDFKFVMNAVNQSNIMTHDGKQMRFDTLVMNS
ncbi:MAG: hypothetical protein ACM3OC_09770 [Deltaproteobacteria bacterium]